MKFMIDKNNFKIPEIVFYVLDPPLYSEGIENCLTQRSCNTVVHFS